MDIAELKGLSSTGSYPIELRFGRLTSQTDKMLKVFQAKGIEIGCMDFAKIEHITSSVTSSVRTSIQKTVTAQSSRLRTGRGGVSSSLKAFSLVPRIPKPVEWLSRAARLVKVYRNKPIKQMSDLQSPWYLEA